ILVDVELDDLDLLPELRGDFVEQRRDDAAGTAPFGPEIDEDGRFGLQYVFIEARVGHIIAGHGSPNLSSPGMPRERGKRKNRASFRQAARRRKLRKCTARRASHEGEAMSRRSCSSDARRF